MPTNTKQYIADIFLQMAKKKSIDKITVTDLVENCHISRQTFYYHFQDITDVMEYRVQTKIEQILSSSLSEKDVHSSVETFVTLAVNNKEIIDRLMFSSKKDHVEKMFVDGLKKYIRKLMEKCPDSTPLSYFQIEAYLHFYASGFTGLLLEYSSKCDDPKQLADLIYNLLPIEK